MKFFNVSALLPLSLLFFIPTPVVAQDTNIGHWVGVSGRFDEASTLPIAGEASINILDNLQVRAAGGDGLFSVSLLPSYSFNNGVRVSAGLGYQYSEFTLAGEAGTLSVVNPTTGESEEVVIQGIEQTFDRSQVIGVLALDSPIGDHGVMTLSTKVARQEDLGGLQVTGTAGLAFQF